jgi:hypothetical protein
MDCHTVVIDEDIVEEMLGVNIFLTLLGGGVTYVVQNWKGGSFNIFRSISTLTLQVHIKNQLYNNNFKDTYKSDLSNMTFLLQINYTVLLRCK